MNTINVSCSEPRSDILDIGIRGENEVTEVVLDYSAWVTEFGDGTVSLLVKRYMDAVAYPVVVTIDDTHHKAAWLVSSVDTEFDGVGEAEFVYTVGEQVAKTVVMRTRVAKDIGNASDVSPQEAHSLSDILADVGASVQANAEIAESAKEASQTAQGKAEQAQDAAESAKRDAETAQGKAESAQTAAETAQLLAQQYGYRLTFDGDTLVIGEEE